MKKIFNGKIMFEMVSTMLEELHIQFESFRQYQDAFLFSNHKTNIDVEFVFYKPKNVFSYSIIFIGYSNDSNEQTLYKFKNYEELEFFLFDSLSKEFIK